MLDDIIATVRAIRPEWQPAPTRAAIGRWLNQHPDATTDDALAAATNAANNPNSRSPAAIEWQPEPHQTQTGKPTDAIEQRLRILAITNGNPSTDAHLAKLRDQRALRHQPGTARCWRHPHMRAALPWDECTDCLTERHDANAHRERLGLPIQPPTRYGEPWQPAPDVAVPTVRGFTAQLALPEGQS